MMFNFLGDGHVARLDVYDRDGKIQWVWLTFTGLGQELGDVDRASYFVRQLVKELKDKYDRTLIKKSEFYWDYPWAGYLWMEDAEGDSISLYWDKFACNVRYCTKEFDEFVKAIQTEGECKDKGGL